MNLGQVYTRRIVADFMVGLFSSKAKRILDPCFGGGVFVDSIVKTTSNDVVAVEIDECSYQKYSNPAPDRCELINDSFFNLNIQHIDGIIMNPPYVRQEEIDDMSSLGVSKEVVRNACRPLIIPSKSNLYVYFILKAALMLSDGGELVAIFPNTWKQTPDGRKFEDVLCSMGAIERYISVHGNPFEGSPLVDVCIVKFIKGGNASTDYYEMTVNDNTIDVCCQSQVMSFSNSNMPLLSSVAIIKRGLTTGANKVFINPTIADKTHVRPILCRPKNVKGYSTNDCAEDEILAIDANDELSEEEIGYLSEKASRILHNGRPLTLKKLIEQDKVWYVIKMPMPPLLIFSYIIRDNVKFVLNKSDCIVRDNFYSIYSNYSSLLLFALLNNYYTYLQLEMVGKKYGNGVLKIQTYDLKSIHIPDISLIRNEDLYALETLAKRLVESSQIEYIDEITNVLSNYYPMPNPKEEYSTLKNNRLQKYEI